MTAPPLYSQPPRRGARRRPQGCAALFAASMMLWASAGAAQQATGKQAWTHAGTSTGLHGLHQPATVTYRPTHTTVPAGSVITQVYADREYAGQADVHTSLCWNGLARCIDLVGRSINTRAFNGLDADKPMMLVHRVTAWRGSRPPLYVKGNVTVWYGAPAGTP